MPDECCSQKSAASEEGELPPLALNRKEHAEALCPRCGNKGIPVQGQTVKAMLAVTLGSVTEGPYNFCRTNLCPVVYFTTDGSAVFTTEDVRERVYQKEPNAQDVPVCYCFRHTAGEIRTASKDQRAEILKDINRGIQADQCACDLRNPQGSCCLGNVRALIRQLDKYNAK